MQTKNHMTTATMWMVFIFGLGNMGFGQSYWEKTYSAYCDSRIAMQPTPDGNFLIAGYTDSYGGTESGWLLKFKPNGDTLWTKTYGGIGGADFSVLQPTPDGNFLIAGSTCSGGYCNNWLLNIKSNGDTLWTKMYDGTKYDFFSAIQSTPDGTFLIATNTFSYGVGSWLLKIKPNGDTLWTKRYWEPSELSSTTAIQPTPDGNFLIVAYTRYGGWLLKIKPNGDTLWTKMFSGTNGGEFVAIQPTLDGNFLIAGNWFYETGSLDGWLVKVKPDGDTLWTKTYGGINEEHFYALQPAPDGNFLIAGYSFFSSSFLIYCIIADQYAYKDSLFTYKIPVYSTDTLNFGYVPLKVPSGMTVSAGGAVSWTPKTDSAYMDHAEFLVMNDLGKKDTLTFNIFVNAAPSIAIKPSRISKTQSKPFEINATGLSGKVKLSVPSFVKSLNIYDMSGRIVGKAAPVMSGSEASVVWPSASSSSSTIPTGKYLAKASAGKNSAVKPFLLVR